MVILVVYLGPMGFFSIWYAAVLFFSKSIFGRGLKLPKSRGSIRKKVVCTSIAARIDDRIPIHYKSSIET